MPSTPHVAQELLPLPGVLQKSLLCSGRDIKSIYNATTTDRLVHGYCTCSQTDKRDRVVTGEHWRLKHRSPSSSKPRSNVEIRLVADEHGELFTPPIRISNGHQSPTQTRITDTPPPRDRAKRHQTPVATRPEERRRQKLTAIKAQLKLTYGLSRSPMRAHFQNMPMNLSARES